MIHVKKGLDISLEELNFRYSKSSGPGGQNVNKVNTRVTLFFDVPNSQCLSNYQKNLILKKHKTRIDKHGVLRVISQRFRTQSSNKDAAIRKFCELLNCALKTKPKRKRTKIPPAAKEKRLREKKKRGQLKKQRSKIDISKVDL